MREDMTHEGIEAGVEVASVTEEDADQDPGLAPDLDPSLQVIGTEGEEKEGIVIEGTEEIVKETGNAAETDGEIVHAAEIVKEIEEGTVNAMIVDVETRLVKTELKEMEVITTKVQKAQGDRAVGKRAKKSLIMRSILKKKNKPRYVFLKYL